MSWHLFCRCFRVCVRVCAFGLIADLLQQRAEWQVTAFVSVILSLFQSVCVPLGWFTAARSTATRNCWVSCWTLWMLFSRCVSECVCAFGLIYRNKEHSNEKLLSFMLDSVDTRKEELLTLLCKTIANALCRTDFVSLTVLGKQSMLVCCHFEVFLHCVVVVFCSVIHPVLIFCLLFFKPPIRYLCFILILCNDSHSHLLLLCSSVQDSVSWQPLSPCVYCVPVYLILCHDSHSHLVCIVFQCTWYCVMTAILTLCVLCSSVPDTVTWVIVTLCVLYSSVPDTVS